MNLKNLKYLYSRYRFAIDSALLSSLEQLREIHLFQSSFTFTLYKLFEQKQVLRLADLKIYLLLNGPDDPAIDSLPALHAMEHSLV